MTRHDPARGGAGTGVGTPPDHTCRYQVAEALGHVDDAPLADLLLALAPPAAQVLWEGPPCPCGRGAAVVAASGLRWACAGRLVVSRRAHPLARPNIDVDQCRGGTILTARRAVLERPDALAALGVTL